MKNFGCIGLLGAVLFIGCSKNDPNGPSNSRVTIGNIKVGSAFVDFAAVHRNEALPRLANATNPNPAGGNPKATRSSTGQSTSSTTSTWQQVLGGTGTLTYASTSSGVGVITDNVNLANLLGYSRTITNGTYNVSLATQTATAVADSFIRFSASNPNFVVSQNGPINFSASTTDGLITVASNQFKAGTFPQFTVGTQTFKFGSTSANAGYYYLYVANNSSGTISLTSTAGKVLTKTFTVSASTQYNLTVNQSSNLGPITIIFSPFTLNTILLTTSTSVTVSTLAGGGPFSTDPFSSAPEGIASDAAGNVYVSDNGKNVIYKIDGSGMVTVFAGTGGFGDNNGPKATATFNQLFGIAFDKSGNLFVCDAGNHQIRKIDPSGMVSTFATSIGSGVLSFPYAITVDRNENLYVALFAVNIIDKIDRFGTVSLVTNQIVNPNALAVDTLGNLFVTQGNNGSASGGSGMITKITPAGTLSTFVSGSPLFALDGIAIDSSDNLYTADLQNFSVEKITPSGAVSILAGLAGNQGTQDGPVASATFLGPLAIAVNRNGTSVSILDFFAPFPSFGSARVRQIQVN